MARRENDNYAGCVRFTEWVRDYFIANEVNDPELWNALRKCWIGQRAPIDVADLLFRSNSTSA